MRFFFHRRSLVPTALGLSLFLASGASGQQASVYLSVDGLPACRVNITSGIHVATVDVEYSFDFQSISFTAVVPPGSIFLGDALLAGGSFTGNSQSGITIDFPTCVPGSATRLDVLQIVFLANAPVSDYTWVVGPAAGKPTIELEDCDGFTMKGTGQYSIYCDKQGFLGPYKPNPPDGAVDVALDATLSFVGFANEIGVADHPIDWPYQGNVHYCGPFPPAQPCVLPLDPGTLLPHTTYYWRALNDCLYCEHGEAGYGDVWSFTTGDAPLSTSKTTWGRVKALYRE